MAIRSFAPEEFVGGGGGEQIHRKTRFPSNTELEMRFLERKNINWFDINRTALK